VYLFPDTSAMTCGKKENEGGRWAVLKVKAGKEILGCVHVSLPALL
jgi:hypothetical protein